MHSKQRGQIDLPYPQPGDRLTQVILRQRDGRTTYCEWKVLRAEQDGAVELKPMRVWQQHEEPQVVVKTGQILANASLFDLVQLLRRKLIQHFTLGPGYATKDLIDLRNAADAWLGIEAGVAEEPTK